MYLLRATRFAGVLLSLAATSALHAQNVGTTVKPDHVVVLTSDSCAQVAEGDVITFVWNPAFEHSGTVTGLQGFTLVFARRGEEQQAAQGQAVIILSARKTGERAMPRDSANAPLVNGYYRSTFRPNLHGVAPGEYHLISAQADARVKAGDHDARPELGNSPVRFPFCLNVVSVMQQTADSPTPSS